MWNSAGEFFEMGGYAFYVWGAYLVTAVCMAAELVLLRRRRQSVESRAAAGRPGGEPHR